MVGVSSFLRPNSVTVFSGDPFDYGRLSTFLLNEAAIITEGVRLDLLNSIQDVSTMEVSRSPLEPEVTDALRLAPRQLTVTGVLSAQPMTGLTSGIESVGGPYVRRDLRLLKKLEAVQEKKIPVTIVAPYRVYSSYSMSISHSQIGGDKVNVTLNLQRVKIVSASFIRVELDTDETLISGASSSDLGRSPVEIVSEPEFIAGGLGG